MEIEKLLKLKILINSEDGNILKSYISDYITGLAGTNIDALAIKGMCMLFEQLKSIPQEYDEMRGIN